ncbi:MAG: hypothetical protein ACPG7W_02400 [Paracoccaceae bacterium]
MMWRVVLAAGAVLTMAACEPVPVSVSTADAQTYAQWEAQREAELTGRPVEDPNAPLGIIPLPGGAADTGLLPAQDAPTSASLPPRQTTPAQTATAQTSATTTTATGGGAPLGITPATGTRRVGSTGVSNENDFEAVSGRRSIEDDAERLARIREQYQQVEPTAVPARPGAEVPNIVAFALSSSHAVGQQVYSRPFRSMRRYERNCAAYLTTDQAQQAFLARGGPRRDRLGIDPDGDGFACGWDPSPFRSIRDGAGTQTGGS